jgi:SAM-dependent methyltransferase
MICVAIQYLQRPVEVLAELRRALRPGAPLIISFSNRCFPTKAVAIWRALDDGGHAQLVELHLRRAGFSNIDVEVLVNDGRSDPMIAVIGTA